MLYKNVNGERIALTEEEEIELQAKWDAEQALKAETRYVKNRRQEYEKEVPIGDQLDAILKQLNYMQMDGQTDLIIELDSVIGKWLAVKRDHPKPEGQ